MAKAKTPKVKKVKLSVKPLEIEKVEPEVAPDPVVAPVAPEPEPATPAKPQILDQSTGRIRP